MFDFGINVLLNPSSFIGPANQVISVLNQLQAAVAKFGTGTGGGSKGLESEFTRLNQVVANTKATFESVASSTSNFRNAMGQVGQATTGAAQGISIFGQKLNEARANLASAESIAKGLGPAFSGIASGTTQATTGLTNLGNSTRTLAAGIAPLAGVLKNFESQVATTAGKLQLLAPVATQTGNAFRAGLATSVIATGAPLANLNSQLASTVGGLNSVGGAATQSATGFGRLREMFQGNRGLVFGFSAFFGTLTGIAFELQLVNDANNQVAQSQAVLNGLVAAGQQGTSQYAQAQQALAKDTRFLEFSSRNLALAFTNLVPDVLLMINGFIQLGEKMKGASAGASAMSTGMQTVSTAMTSTNTAVTATNTGMTALTTGMTTATSATTTFSAAGTAVTGSLTPMRGALQTTTVALAETVAAESSAILTSEGLVASNAGMGVSAQGASKAIQSIVPSAVAAEGAEVTLMEENIALGASFDALGVQAKAAGNSLGAVGKTGGLKGLLGGVLGAGGGVALPILGALGFVAFAAEFAKSAEDVVNSRLLAEKAIEDSNKRNSEGIATLQSDIQAGTANMTTYWNAYADQVNNTATRVQTAQQKMAIANLTGGNVPAPPTTTPGAPPKPGTFEYLQQFTQGNEVFPDFGKQGTVVPKSGPFGTGPGGAFEKFQNQPLPATPGGRELEIREAVQKRLDFYKYSGFRSPETLGQGALPPLSEVLAAQNKRQQADALAASKAGQVDLGRAGVFKLGKEGISAEDLASLKADQAVIEGILAAKPKGADLTKDQLKTLGEATKDITEIIGGASDATKTAADIEKEKQKVYQKSQDDMNAYNKLLDAQPKILQDVGTATKQLSDDEIERQDIIRNNAALFIGQANAMGVSLGVAQKVGEVGAKITDGLIDQRDTIVATNLVWGNMGTIVKGTNQTMGEWITTQQQSILGSIDVTQALTNQTKAQFLTNQGYIQGKLAAQSFLEETIVGVAQNKQYVQSLQGIITAMGIELPAGMKLTAEQAQAVIQSFEETGSAAGAFAAIINDRIEPAVQRLGDVLTAKSWKEFKDAFKGLEFGDAPDKLVKKFQDFDNMLRKINEDGREMQTVFDQMDIMQSLGKLDVKTFTQGLSAMEKQVEHIGKLQDIDVSNIISFLDALKNTKDPAMLVKYHDLIQKIEEASKNGYTSQELADINNDIDKIDPSKLKEVSDHLKEISKNAKEILKNDWSKFGKFVESGVITSPDAGYVSPAAPQKPEDKFNSAVDKFAGAVNQFTTKPATPPALGFGPPQGGNLPPGVNEFTSLPQGPGISQPELNFRDRLANALRKPDTKEKDVGKSKFGIVSDAGGGIGVGAGVGAGAGVALGGGLAPRPSATDAFKGGGPLAPMVTQSAEMSKQIQTIFSSMFTAVLGIVSGMAKAISTEFNGMTTSVVKVVTAMMTSVVAVFNGMAKGVFTLVNAMVLNVAKIVGAMAVNVFNALGLMITNSITVISAFVKGVQTLFAGMADNSLEIVVAFQTNVTTVIAALTTDVMVMVANMDKNVQASVAEMADSCVEIIVAFQDNVVTAITDMADTSLEAVVAFKDNVVTAMAEMADNTVEIIVAMDDNVVTAIEDMAKRGGSAADSFASDMQSSLGKVETAANDAASAVSNLADEVAALDGSTAVVTVKTHFVTVGSPPSTGGASGSVSFGAVLAAANAGPFGSHGLVKSFAEGGLDTTVGPRMIVFGDNPGGHETHAFIPHDNPFPILRQLAKMFRGKGSASSEIIDRTLDRAGEVIINATFVIENMMDGQKVGTTIARKVFKKMRTR